MANDNSAKIPAVKAVALWTVTTIASAVIGFALKGYWEAPRPVSDLVSLDMTLPDPNAKISLPDDLVNETRDHPYFETLPAAVTVKRVQGAIAKAAGMGALWNRLNARTAQLITLLQTDEGPIDRRRLNFCRVMVGDGDGSELGRIIKLVMQLPDATPLPDRYSHHPQGQEVLAVQVTSADTMVLSEINEAEAVREAKIGDADEVRQEIRVTNQFRRLLIYLEPEVLVPLLEKTEIFIRSSVDSSTEIQQSLGTLLLAQEPSPHLVAKVIVTNRGTDALALRNYAALLLKMPSREADTPESVVPILMVSGPDLVTVLEGDKAVALTFTSEESVKDLVKDHADLQSKGSEDPNSRLMQLLEAGGISASIRLARAGVSDKSAPLAKSEYRPVGPQSREATFNLLATR